jgi:hypothetical protein
LEKKSWKSIIPNYFWFQAQVPAPITEEMEAEKAEKRKLINKLKREKEKQKKQERMEKEKEQTEQQRYRNLSDREKVCSEIWKLLWKELWDVRGMSSECLWNYELLSNVTDYNVVVDIC